MKKTLIVLGIIIAGLYAVLTLLDKSEYVLEKQIFRVQKEYARIMADPKVVPAKEFDNLTARYQRLIAKYPRSQLTPNMFLFIGALYNARGDNVRAIDNFSEVVRRYPDNRPLCAMSLLNVANTYANLGDEEKTLATFARITREYVDTDAGFNMPLLTANYYLNKGDTARHKQALGDAADFYKQQSQQNPDSPAAFNALRLLVTVYYTQENWAKAVDTLEEILLKYARSDFMTRERAALFIRSINTVCMTKLNDYLRAERIYKRFMAENPGHALEQTMQKMLEAIETLKTQNVKVTTKEQE